MTCLIFSTSDRQTYPAFLRFSWLAAIHPVPLSPTLDLFVFLFTQRAPSSHLVFVSVNGTWAHRMSTSGAPNELHVQLRCSCLLWCESSAVIDVAPWSFLAAASNILLFIGAHFHLLCACICVRLFVQILIVQTHLHIHVCAFARWALYCVCVCVCADPDYQPSDVGRSDHWGCFTLGSLMLRRCILKDEE